MPPDDAMIVGGFHFAIAGDDNFLRAFMNADQQDMVVMIVGIVRFDLPALNDGVPVQDFLRSVFFGNQSQSLQPVWHGLFKPVFGAVMNFKLHGIIHKTGNCVQSHRPNCRFES